MPEILTRNHELLNKTELLKNNDPLAHVDLYLELDDRELVERRTYIEYVTDMGERLVEQPFKKSFEYSVDGDNLISDTGVYLNTFLEKGYQAAVNDVRERGFDESHALRARAFYEQLPQLREWFADKSDATHKVFFSLCAPKSELNEYEARRQGFKQERLLASIQLYEKTHTGIKLHAFSLDGLSLARLSELYTVFGVEDAVAASTIEQLIRPLSIDATMPANEAVESIIYHYDKLLGEETGHRYVQGVDHTKFKKEANAHVEEHGDAYDLYRQTIIEVANSLKIGKVTNRLGDIVNELKFSIVTHEAIVPPELRLQSGQPMRRDAAAGVIDYLRTKAIPHYLTTKLETKSDASSGSSGTSYQDVSAAGAQAVVNNISYEGACASSDMPLTAKNEISELGSVYNRANSLKPEEWVWTSGKCVVENCPTKPSKTTVGPCSVCVGCQSIYDSGKDPKQLYRNKNISIIEIFSALFSGDSETK